MTLLPESLFFGAYHKPPHKPPCFCMRNKSEPLLWANLEIWKISDSELWWKIAFCISDSWEKKISECFLDLEFYKATKRGSGFDWPLFLVIRRVFLLANTRTKYGIGTGTGTGTVPALLIWSLKMEMLNVCRRWPRSLRRGLSWSPRPQAATGGTYPTR